MIVERQEDSPGPYVEHSGGEIYSVFHLEDFQCKRGYALARLYSAVAWDERRSSGEFVTKGPVRLTLDERFAASFQPDKTGVDATAWWCIPSKRACYEKTKFTNWGGTLKRGDKISAPRDTVYKSSEHTIATILEKEYSEQCVVEG